jgi:hypothetical protein
MISTTMIRMVVIASSKEHRFFMWGRENEVTSLGNYPVPPLEADREDALTRWGPRFNLG